MNSTIPEFGSVATDVDYIVRPGAYGLLFDDDNRLLVVVTATGTHLPCGGREGVESAEENLRRELQEECGVHADTVTFVSTAVQYLQSPGEGYFKKICEYYLVETFSREFRTGENHLIQWLHVDDAVKQLSHESHIYGVLSVLDQR